MIQNLTRRRYLKLASAGGLATTAGCSTVDNLTGQGDGGDEELDVPDYAKWLTTDEDNAVFYVYADLGAFPEDEEGEGDNDTDSEDGSIDETYKEDPMIAMPFVGLFAIAFVGAFGLASYGLGDLLTQEESDRDLDSVGEEYLMRENAMIISGSIDSAEVSDQLTSKPEDYFGMQFEQTTTIGAYEVYEPVEDDDEAGTDDDAKAAAVRDDTVIVTLGGDDDEAETFDPIPALQTTIDAQNGDVERAHETHEEFAWLLSEAGAGDISIGGYGDDPSDLMDDDEEEETETPVMDSGSGDDSSGDDDGSFGTPDDDSGTDDDGTGSSGFSEWDWKALENANGFTSALRIDPETETADGDFAAIVEGADEETFTDLLGSSGSNTSVSVDGDRVTASSEWSDLDGTGAANTQL